MLKRLMEDPVSHQVEIMTRAVQQATVDPDWFCNEILRSPNDPWQSECLNVVADLDRARLGLPTLFNHELKQRLSIVAFHGPGKTHFVAKLAHWWNFTRRGLIAATAPKEKQLRTRLWPEFRKVSSEALDYYKQLIKVDTTKVTWADDVDWCMLAETASQPENLQGLHHKWILFLVDEASGVNEEMFPAIEGALTTPGSFEVLIGNPTRATGEFWASHNKAGTRELYYQKAIQPQDSPRIDPKWVKAMIQKYGKASPVVQIRVFGKFVEADANQLLTLYWIEAARDRKREEDGSFPRLRVTVDVADGGEDETVITVAKHYDSYTKLLRQYRFNFPASVSPIKAGEEAERIFEHWKGNPANGDDLVVDSIGVGAGTAGYLIKQELPVIQYKGGESSDDTQAWRNRRTQSYLVMRDALRDGTLDIDENFLDNDDWEDFCAQMCSIRTNPGTERVEDLETKKMMKARNIKSPDMADSTSMQFATQSPVIGMTSFVPQIVGESEID